MPNSRIVKLFQTPALSEGKTKEKLAKLRSIYHDVVSIETEYCYYVEWIGEKEMDEEEMGLMKWVLSPTFNLIMEEESKLIGNAAAVVIEIGPRLNFCTAYSTNAVSVCKAIGMKRKVERIERSTRYLIDYKGKMNKVLESNMVNALHDRMTETRYLRPIDSFKLNVRPDPWMEVDILGEGKSALEKISNSMGLSFDTWDIDYYTDLFKNVLKRNPTSVECFDLAQSNSEHSRHWFFKGRLIVDGKEEEKSLIQMIMETQDYTNANNVIKFNDNSSAIQGFPVTEMKPANPSEASLFKMYPKRMRHIIFTAETHNFPTGVAPFQGATTGTGGRIRDVQAAGRGSHVIAGTAGYSFGNLLLPNYSLPWEDEGEKYANNFASPVEICIEASNGASDYGNKFGEPVIAGFARNFGQRFSNGERCEYIKPIMFSGGIGSIDDDLVKKEDPEKGMLVAKLGGPVYRIGVGGGAASSIEIQGDEVNEDLNFGAVQRGDAEMEQKLNRVIRACIEFSDQNPIKSIHDQGAGGNGNVLKEIVDPKGAIIYAKSITLADPTINTLELWGAEYQESNAILIKYDSKALLERICKREKCPVDFVGEITGDGRIRLVENDEAKRHPVDLELEHVLGSMPRKKFQMIRKAPIFKPLDLPTNLTTMEALNRILRLPSVASKRYLTNKVDRSVTGLIAQQQCIGYLHTPLSDYGVISLSYFEEYGSATSIGEQPIKGLICSDAGARMSVGEALTNLMFARISNLRDVKCSGNWMWPAKLEGEGTRLADACKAMCRIMMEIGIGVDGGKDSLSMAAKIKKEKKESEIVKSPGTLVISCYAPVPDINVKVTPELQGEGKLVYLNFSGTEKVRSGGTALAQVFGQVGDSVPDIEDSKYLREGFKIVQKLIKDGQCTAGHDVSDGGLLTCVLEMAFGTNCGLELDFNLGNKEKLVEGLFSEECGVVLELKSNTLQSSLDLFKEGGLNPVIIGEGRLHSNEIHIAVCGETLIKDKTENLRDIWEETSFQLEMYQCNEDCVKSERLSLKNRKTPKWKLNFNPDYVQRRSFIEQDKYFTSKPRVAVVREEGTNGDREMIASLFTVGFEVVDVMITDIVGTRELPLDAFRGLIFPGGFSYADVLGSARGWAATMLFNEKANAQLEKFKSRRDTFSFGVCNGCQLLALLGWVGDINDGEQGTLLGHNDSERFESRFVSVKVMANNKSIMLNNMGECVMGVWIAHGEGKFVFKENVLNALEKEHCVSLCYVDDDGNPTMRYPLNPNGSVNGIAGICSKDGRHLAMMPHPERAIHMWQWPYIPKEWKEMVISPWCRMFRNAYEWCMQ